MVTFPGSLLSLHGRLPSILHTTSLNECADILEAPVVKKSINQMPPSALYMFVLIGIGAPVPRFIRFQWVPCSPVSATVEISPLRPIHPSHPWIPMTHLRISYISCKIPGFRLPFSPSSPTPFRHRQTPEPAKMCPTFIRDRIVIHLVRCRTWKYSDKKTLVNYVDRNCTERGK